MRKPPDWAVEVRSKMLANGIRSVDVANRLGKKEAWVSNNLTGIRKCESMKKAICECVEEMVREREAG